MTSNDQEQDRAAGNSSRSEEQDAALFGPPGRGEYQRGDSLQFRDPQSGGVLTAKVVFVRAPARAVVGGRIHPTVYWCYIAGEHLPRAVYPSDIIERAMRARE